MLDPAFLAFRSCSVGGVDVFCFVGVLVDDALEGFLLVLSIYVFGRKVELPNGAGPVVINGDSKSAFLSFASPLLWPPCLFRPGPFWLPLPVS